MDGARPILVTGAAGFVGRHVVPRLREAFPDRPVIALTRRAGVDTAALGASGGVVADLADLAATDAVIGTVRPAVVVHLAAHSSVGAARFCPDKVWRDNRNGTYSLVTALARHVPDATVLVASTGEVYGRNLRLGPATEETPPSPVGTYAHSKLAAEYIAATVLPPAGRLIIARPMNHVGVGQSEDFVVSSFAAQIARIEAGRAPPIIRVGNLAAARDFLDVRDVAAGYVAMLQRAEALPRRTILNVVRGEAVPIATLLDLFLSLSTVDVRVEVDPTRLRANEIPVATARADRLARLVPWPPRRTLAETLAGVLEDHRRRIAGPLLQD